MAMKHRHLFWIMELFIWLLILFAIASGINYARYNYKKQFNTYQIFLPDVDGLIVGSTVRMMGIHLGYVSQLNIVGEDVFVKFVITYPNVKVPPRSIATVEFSGLGGSKSLEIYPPRKSSPSSDKFIIAQSPKRIHDAFRLLGNMFEKLMDITDDVSNFTDNVSEMKIQKQNSKFVPKTPQSFLNTSDEWLNKANSDTNNLNLFVFNLNKKINNIKNK